MSVNRKVTVPVGSAVPVGRELATRFLKRQVYCLLESQFAPLLEKLLKPLFSQDFPQPGEYRLAFGAITWGQQVVTTPAPARAKEPHRPFSLPLPARQQRQGVQKKMQPKTIFRAYDDL